MDGKKRTVAKKLQPSMYITSPYFKDGGTLLNDLAFSCHYHFTTVNQVIHLSSVATLIAGILWILSTVSAHLYFTYRLPLVFSIDLQTSTCLLSWPALLVIAYSCHHFWAWDRGVTIGFALYTLAAAALSGTWLAAEHAKGSTPVELVPWVMFILLLVGLTQLFGHVAFEGSLPAFRAFEAAVTTPFFLMLNFGFWLGYKPELRDAVYKQSKHFIGTERRSFGWGRNAALKAAGSSKH